MKPSLISRALSSLAVPALMLTLFAFSISCPAWAKTKKTKANGNNDDDPCNGMSAMAQCECANRELESADKKLNNVYRKLLSTLSDDESADDGEGGLHPKSRLVNAQRTWIKFRDANCEFDGEYAGGNATWRNAYYLYCLGQMTRLRTKELQEYLDK